MGYFFYQVAAIQAEVTKQQQETEEDLAKAEPALQAANAALNTLNRVNHLYAHKSTITIAQQVNSIMNYFSLFYI